MLKICFILMSLSTVYNFVECTELLESITRSPAKKTDYPGFVSIQLNGHHRCSGIMLDLDFVLTSASCLTGSSNASLDILGGVITQVNGSRGVKRKVKVAIKHEGYEKVTGQNDLALLHSDAFDDTSMGNTLTSLKMPDVGDKCQVVAWRTINEETLIVEKADVIIDEPFACSVVNKSSVLNHSLCVKGRFSNDPGAILVCDNDVAGIFTQPTNTTNEFNLFTDVSHFNDWIDTKFKAALNDELPTELSIDEAAKEELTKAELITSKPQVVTNDPLLKKVQTDCIVPFDHCFKVWEDLNTPSPGFLCKRGFHIYSCEYLMKRYIHHNIRHPDSRFVAVDPVELYFRQRTTQATTTTTTTIAPHSLISIFFSNGAVTHEDAADVKEVQQYLDLWNYMSAGYSYYDLI